jgi:hypothetical protein
MRGDDRTRGGKRRNERRLIGEDGGSRKQDEREREKTSAIQLEVSGWIRHHKNETRRASILLAADRGSERLSNRHDGAAPEAWGELPHIGGGNRDAAGGRSEPGTGEVEEDCAPAALAAL